MDFEAHDRRVIEEQEARIAALEAQLAERMKVKPQHVAYYDDGQFRWMSGIAPRNCELYALEATPPEQDEQVVYTDPDGKVWHPHRGYWCWKVSSELAQAQERIKELEAQLAAVQDKAKQAAAMCEAGYGVSAYNVATSILSALEATPPAPKVTECATEGCGCPSTVRFERGGVGAYYCAACYLKVQAIPHNSAALTRPSEQAVTDEMVDAAERTMAAHYERPLKAWELTALHEALTAAQEAGKP